MLNITRRVTSSFSLESTLLVSLIRSSYSVHANVHLLVPQPTIEREIMKKFIVLYRNSQNTRPLTSITSRWHRPAAPKPIKSPIDGDFAKTRSGELDQIYLVTPSSLDEILNRVNSSSCWLLITYPFMTLCGW